jgi:hypothetical protein
MNATLVIVTCGEYHIIVWLHTAADPSDEEWNQSMAAIQGLVTELDGNLSKIRTLAISDGGAPNTLQRAQFNKLIGVGKAAAVTTVLMNPVKRGILTAVTWLNPNFRAYPPDRSHLAFEHLEITAHKAKLMAEVEAACRRLSPPLETLRLMKEASSKAESV